jgi:hypothetical protein
VVGTTAASGFAVMILDLVTSLLLLFVMMAHVSDS